MKFIVRVFTLLNKLKPIYAPNGTYSELNKEMKNFPIMWPIAPELREEIINLINDMDVEKQAECIASMKNPGTPREELILDKYTIYDLNDRELINFFGAIMWTVSVVEKDNLILLKYNECIWNTGWHKYAMECRGKVIDRNTLEVVSYPFDKFFNLDEHASTNMNYVVNKIATAERVSLTNKLDGSTIIVSNNNGTPLVTTNGSFENDQTKWAMKIFNEKYVDFIKNVPAGYTFVFELIHPENRIILDYGDVCDLFLIAVRENILLDNGLVSYDALVKIAEKFNLNIVEQETFTNLDDLCKKAREMTNANKEGWVIRTENGSFVDYMFKLKLEEYFVLHRAKAHVSIKNVYNLYSQGILNDFINTVDDATKQEVVDMLEEINILIGKVYNEVVNRAELLMTEMDIDRNTILNVENKSKLIEMVKSCGKDKMFGAYVISYIKGNSIPNACRKMRTSKFLELYNYFN